MASDLIVPVVEVRNIRIHPNADMLSISEVLGYQIVNGLVEDPEGEIVRFFIAGERDERGRRVPAPPLPFEGGDGIKQEIIRYSFRYKDGDKAVYFPADTILSDKLAEQFNVKYLLKSGNRVGRTRLRGEPSFGLCVELPEGVDWRVGQNVAEHYDVEKYAPPTRSDPGDFADYDGIIDPHFVEYTSIQNGKIFFEKFGVGEEVIATEKIHGANSRIGIINGQLVAGSRTTRKKNLTEGSDCRDFLFWSPLVNESIKNLLHHVANGGPKTVILFGEVYGQGVQSLHYGVGGKSKGYRAFDLYVDGGYWDYDSFKLLCDKFGVETAPVLYRGPFDLTEIQEVADGDSTLPGANNIREGVVVRPAKERRDPSLGRMVLKFIGTEYELSKHKKKDETDV